jgi:hypothetical protein
MNQVLEGVIGSLPSGKLGNPQAMNVWLRAMKDNISFNSRFIENDHVLTAVAGIADASDAVKASESWLYGWFATSIDVQANVALTSNVSTFDPGTTALDYHGVIYLATAASTTPTIGGQIWFPFQYFDVGIYGDAVYHSNYDTTAVAATVNGYWVYRNQ